MVLAADPVHRGALEAYRAAHQVLLDRSDGENFWETGWLRQQLDATDAKLGTLS
jgi:hypothetical protein